VYETYIILLKNLQWKQCGWCMLSVWCSSSQCLSVCCTLSVNTYFVWCDLSVLSLGISVKRGTDVHHVMALLKRFSRSRVKVVTRLNCIMVEACRSTECRQGSLVLILVLHFDCNVKVTATEVSVLHILGKSNGYIRSDHEEALYNTPENVGDLSTCICVAVLLVLLPLQHVVCLFTSHLTQVSSSKLYYSWQKQWSVRILSIFVRSSSL